MKRTFFATSLALVVLLSCSKEEEPYKNNGLIGKWKLVETLTDPGDGSGTFTKVREEASSVVEFKANGDFKEIKGLIYSSVNPYDTYRLLGNNEIELSVKDNKQNIPPTTWYYKDLSATSVILGFPCFEPCMGRYTAIR